MLLLEGTHLLQETFRTNIFPKEIFATSSWILSNHDLLEQIPQQTLLFEVTESVLKFCLTTISPDGVASVVPLTALPKNKEEKNFVLALDRLQDPGNLGTLFRTALAANVEEIWLASGADPLSPKVLRASSGAILQMPYERLGGSEDDAIQDLVCKLKSASSAGYQVLGTLVSGCCPGKRVFPYWEIDWLRPTVLVLGNEGSGLHSSIQACCTSRVTLPHSSAVESLNVASAAVPLLLERLRAKMTTESNLNK